MDARFYNVEDLDIQQIANNLENIYRSQGYQTQQVNANKDQVMVQLKKGGDLEMLIGLQAALSVIIQRSGGGTVAMIGQQKWMDKAAVGAVGLIAAPILWPLMLTAGAGAIRQASLGNQVLNVVDGLVRQQRPEIQIGPVPVQIIPQIQQQWAPPPPQYLSPPAYVPPPQYAPQVVDATPAPAPTARRSRLRCPTCNTPYEPGDTFCTGCGKALVTLCPNCKTEVKDNSAFCPKCGASLYQATLTQPAAQQPPAPSPAPIYTPPAPAAPPVPVYTPPPAPAPTPSAKPTYTPPPAQVTRPPAPVYTPPPVPQEPSEAPKPTITYMPASPQQTPAPKPPRKQPDVPYYTPPPVNPQQVSPKSKTPPAPQPQPIQAKPAAQAAFDATAAWGYLTFSDGTQVKLAGERAIVGRADHDVGGLQPEVDLSAAQGADTVSRIHAQIEHIGSTFTVTDLNSTNATRLNGKRLEPDQATPLNDGDALVFGKVQSTFKKA